MIRFVLLVLLLSFCTVAQRTLTDKNNHITRIPTVFDFMPLGITAEMKENGKIIYPTFDEQCSFR